MLDNSPKNRSAKLFKYARKHGFGLLFITPGTPQDNMAESYFLCLKRQYTKLNLLARINNAPDSISEAVRVVLEALRAVFFGSCIKINCMFMHELETTFKSFKRV